MSAPDFNGSGGVLRGHGVAFALIAIFAGMAIVVAYAASDGAVFGVNSNLTPSSDIPVSNNGTAGATVISRDIFENNETVPVEPKASITLEPESQIIPTEQNELSQEERRLLAISKFPWESIADRYIASDQDAMNEHRQPVLAQPAPEPFLLSDKVIINVDRARYSIGEADDTLELGDIIGMDIPTDVAEDEGSQEEERQSKRDDIEEARDNEDQSDDDLGEGSSGQGSGGNSGAEDNSGSGGDNEESRSDDEGPSGSGEGNTENGNSNESSSEDLGSGSNTGDNSTGT